MIKTKFSAKIVAVFLAVLTIWTFAFSLFQANKVYAASSYEVGDKISYGTYNDNNLTWTVLDNDGNGHALVLCDVAVQKMAFGSSNVYATSDVRTWLNGTFYDAISTDTTETILAVNTPDASSKTTSNIVNSGGTDHVFLLSKTDVFGDEETGEKAFIPLTDDLNKEKKFENKSSTWWIRTPNNSLSNGRYIYIVDIADDDEDGTSLGSTGYSWKLTTVVPAMYISAPKKTVASTGIVNDMGLFIAPTILVLAVATVLLNRRNKKVK